MRALFAAVLWVLAACTDDDGAVAGADDLTEITVTTARGTEHELHVWVADSSAERTSGLMGVTDLGEADGMLFLFDDEAAHRFYMWRTPLPLDIAFFAADGTFVDSATMEPCLQATSESCARYAPEAPVLTALEVPAGRLADLGVGPGSQLSQGCRKSPVAPESENSEATRSGEPPPPQQLSDHGAAAGGGGCHA